MSTAAPSHTLDPLAFLLDALSFKGALLERNERTALAIVPEPLARELGSSEELVLAGAPAAGSTEVGCGFGTVILEKLIASMRSELAVCNARAELGAARAQHARALVEGFAPRNAVADLLDVSVREGSYIAAWISFAAEADDRLDGLVSIVFAAGDASEPDAALIGALDPTIGGAKLKDLPGPISLPAAAARILAVRAERAIRSLCADFVAGVERRHLRDHDRTCEYFTELIREARSPKRKVDPSSIGAKVAHLEKEREAKLLELRERYLTRISGTPAALILARVPEAVARVRVRRRKETRELELHLPALAKTFSKLACDGCAGVTAKPAFCDDALHLLCESCLPHAQGRPACAKCRR